MSIFLGSRAVMILSLALLAATPLAALTLAAPTASADPTPAAAFTPVLRDTTLHAYTLTVLSVYTHDDGDPGVSGAGEFNFVKLHINGDNNYLYLSNTNPWHYGVSNREWQHYRSDTGYTMPGAIDFNRYENAAKVGSTVHVWGLARELDTLTSHATVAQGGKDVPLPAPGHHTDATVMIEGTNGASHVRLAVTYRLSTS